MSGYRATGDAASPAHAEMLPPPTSDALALTTPLVRRIRHEIQGSGGRIPFPQYMELALYAPGLGYYAGGLRKFGADGDFVTAPELSQLFSHCLARQCLELLDRLDGGELLEFGAGSGLMAADILGELARQGGLPERYLILELSSSLRRRQSETLRARVPELVDRVAWLDCLPEPGFRGGVVANEVLDAMPVHRIRVQQKGYSEFYVGWRDGRFVWELGPPSTRALTDALDAISDELQGCWTEGYVTEVGLAQPAWVRSIGEQLAAGGLLVIDYGFPRHEFYHPERSDGTLMCHYRHRAHSDPLRLTGLQDITAHVDFTAIARAGLEAGLQVAGYTSQAAFLLGNGLTEELEAAGADMTRSYLTLANQAKRLTSPGEMGELFKVLALTKGIQGSLRGFTIQNRRGRL